MHASLTIGMTLLFATVCGVALWQPGAAVVSAPLVAAAPRPASALRPPIGAVESLARALVGLCDETQRCRAVLADEAHAGLLVADHGAAAAVAGLPRSLMSEAQAAIVQRLLERAADTLCGEEATTALQRFGGELVFVWAGGADVARGAYVRLAAAGVVVEYYRAPGGSAVHAAWRDLERDARSPWLRDLVRDMVCAPRVSRRHS